MGAITSQSKKGIDDNSIKGKIITFQDLDKSVTQSQQSMRVTQDTQLIDIINYIKEKLGVQQLTLYYEQYQIEETSLRIFNYLDWLPSRNFGYKIQTRDQSILLNQSQGAKSQEQSKLLSTKKSNQTIQNSQQKIKISALPPQNPKQNLLPSKISQSNTQQKIQSYSQHSEIDSQNIIKQDEQQILLYLLSLAQQKIQSIKQENERLQTNNKNLLNDIQILKQEKTILEEKLKQINFNNYNLIENQALKKFDNVIDQSLNIYYTKSNQQYKNQCGHTLKEDRIQQILMKALENKTYAFCDQCNPKISSNILLKMGYYGQAQKELQALCDISQLFTSLKSQKKYTIYKCQQSFCSFFFIWDQRFEKQITKNQSFCPQCLQNQLIRID